VFGRLAQAEVGVQPRWGEELLPPLSRKAGGGEEEAPPPTAVGSTPSRPARDGRSGRERSHGRGGQHPGLAERRPSLLRRRAERRAPVRSRSPSRVAVRAF